MKFNNALEALYACRNHWSMLWITGSSYKLSYEPANSWPYGCACCLFAGAFIFDEKLGPRYGSNYDSRDCSKCLLNGYAWEEARDGGCESDPDSFYDEWRCHYETDNHDLEVRKFWAYKMVQACNRAIEDIICNNATEATGVSAALTMHF